MENIFSLNKPSLVKTPIFIDGFGRTGKLLLGKIISCFNGIENFQNVSLIEQIISIHLIGSITQNAAIALIKAQIDQHTYHMYLGRNLNFRFDDATSLYNSLQMDEYLRRSLEPYSPKLKKEILNNKSKPLFVLHESFSGLKLLYEAYPKMKFIYLSRHPIDVVYSWFINDWGSRYKTDPLFTAPVVQTNNDLVPWHAADWKDEYVSLSNVDRVIKNISYLLDIEKKPILH